MEPKQTLTEDTISCPRCGASNNVSTRPLFVDCACGQRIIVLPADDDLDWIKSVIESAHESQPQNE